MTRTLPAVDTVTYNGFTFPAALHSSVSIQPIESSDGRNIKYSTYRLRLTCVLVASDLDAAQAPGTSLTAGFAGDMSEVRKKLLRSGKTLSIVGIGLNLTVDQTSVVGFGPKPKMMQWDVLGANQAINFTWEVEFTVSNCDSPGYSTFGEFSYSVGFSIGEDGLTTRVISGEYETFVTRLGSSINTSSDTQWDQILVPRIPGFIRTHEHQLSPDKKTTRFTITDREHESDNPLYPGMIRMSIQQNIHHNISMLTGSSNNWTITISGSITVAPGVARSLAWTAFLVVFRDRYDQQIRAAGDAGNDKGVMAITAIDISEDIFARTVSFSVSYTLLTTIQTILAASGFGRPVPGDWNAWSVSLAEITGPRGSAGLRHYATDDIIVDFCGGSPIPTPTQPTKRSPGEDSPGLSKNCPPEASSWYAFHWGLQIDGVASKSYGTTMGKRPKETEKVAPGLPADTEPGDDEEASGSGTAESKSYEYSRGRGVTRVVLYGWAIRIGYHINIPSISTIGGKKVGKPVQDKITASRVVGNAGGCKMYYAKWYRVYYVNSDGKAIVDDVPTQFKTPDLESPNQ